MLLDIVEVAKSHSGINLAAAFAKILDDFGICHGRVPKGSGGVKGRNRTWLQLMCCADASRRVLICGASRMGCGMRRGIT